MAAIATPDRQCDRSHWDLRNDRTKDESREASVLAARDIRSI